ncbi:hypothetical protein [Streptomyces sp. CBMA123]|uniref:hypothetical protein n=1 Tax=Streptomyces sp. CBMA123 TaxID=1896313 RepID=UPI0016620615|nr:hypothetical protein [Streptomyces sp. CBMA123]
MRSIVSACDRLADDPQALETYLLLSDIDHDMVTSYRNAIRDAEAGARRPRRNPGQCQRTVRHICCSVIFTAHHDR